MGIVSIFLADGARDDDLGHGSFGIVVHASPFASERRTDGSCRSSSDHQALSPRHSSQ
jgi:hypothetical protein